MGGGWKGAEGAGWDTLDLLEDKAAKAPESCSAAQNTEATSWWQASLHQDRQRYWRKIETLNGLVYPRPRNCQDQTGSSQYQEQEKQCLPLKTLARA